MNWIIDCCVWLSAQARPHLATLSVAIVATFLVLAGDNISRFLKRRLGGTPFVLRVLIFSFACTLCYGAIAVLVAPFVRHQLAGLSNTLLSPVLMGLFLAIGWIAERKNYI